MRRALDLNGRQRGARYAAGRGGADRLASRLAVGRGPCRGQPAISARPEMEGALARLLEDELVIDHPALAVAPFGRLVLVDAGPDRVDAVQVATVHILDGEKDLTAVRIKAVPARRPLPATGVAAPGGAGVPVPEAAEWARARGWISSSGRRSSALGASPHAASQLRSPSILAASTKSRMQLPKRRRKSPVDEAQWPMRNGG